MIDWRIVTIQRWPGEPTKARRRDRFDSAWSATTGLLADELRHLRARNVLLQMAVTEAEIRLDGWIRAHARPSHPGVILTFDAPEVGALSYPCDTYLDWQANVRAIALSLQALRAVDRHGVTKRGEQYAGFKALPAAGGSTSTMTAAQAATAIVEAVDAVFPDDIEEILWYKDRYRDWYRRAAAATHPDTPGGSTRAFQRVQEARRVLEAHHGG